MKTILIQFSDGLGDAVFAKSRDNVTAPFILLKERLYSLGYELKIAGNNSLENCEWVIFINSPFPERTWRNALKNFFKNKPDVRDLYAECRDKGMDSKMALFLWEGRSVKPSNYAPTVLNKFSTIFTWNDDCVDNVKFFKFYLPIPETLGSYESVPFPKKKLLVNISANKYSSLPDELYSERRKTIKFFEKNYPNDFDLYGRGWNEPRGFSQKLFPFLIEKFASYRGTVDNKLDKLPSYKFSLSYENLEKERGYVTEKIFDAMRGGTVPIYLGASNITDYVPSDTFIDRRKFARDEELADYIEKMTENEYNQYLKAINIFLQSDQIKLFFPENFVHTIIKTLQLHETAQKN